MEIKLNYRKIFLARFFHELQKNIPLFLRVWEYSINYCKYYSCKFFFFFISKIKRGGTNDDNRSNYQDGQSYSFNKLD